MSLIIALSILTLVASYISHSKRSKHPPGPKPLPIIGNVLDFPREKAWETFSNWKQQYGDVVYLNILGTPMVILNSLKACNDLLEKRSAKYSDRPRAVMLSEITGLGYMFPLMNNSPQWRKHRRLFHQYFNDSASRDYRPIQQRSVHHFLQQLLTEPAEFLDHSRLLFWKIILGAVYDIKVKDNQSVFIQKGEAIREIVRLAGIPGQFLVDVFPALKHLPSWFPGAGFKKSATEWRQAAMDIRDLPFAHVKEEMEKGTAGPSVLASMLEECGEGTAANATKDRETSEDIAKGCAVTAYIGAADTLYYPIQTFFMVMANHPDIQQEAQRELDALLGQTRLPTFADEAHLPVVTAITKELLRCYNVVPLGVAHQLAEEDEYNGYTIPKGTIVLQNIWAILHDSKTYPDPFTFNPRRWLMETSDGLKINPAVQDPSVAIFGFGRRSCPGRRFGIDSLFITVASVLACFDIKPLDAQGEPTKEVGEEFSTNGLIIHPLPFKVSAFPRSVTSAQLIKDLQQ